LFAFKVHLEVTSAYACVRLPAPVLSVATQGEWMSFSSEIMPLIEP